MATLSGSVNISLTNNFRPTLGSMFTILTFGGRSGDFATYNGLTQSNGVVFSKTITSTSLILQVTSEAFTPTPTITGQLTQTPTMAPTLSATPTLTGAATATSTPTQSPVPTNTPSSSPTQSRTSTPTPILTPTSTGGPTATTTATARPTSSATLTETPSVAPTATQTQTASSTPTVTATPTPTSGVTPGMVALFGRVLSPGLGGFPGSHGQVALGDVAVDLYLCEVRMPCLATGNPVTSIFTQPDGRFVITVPKDLLQNKLPIVLAHINPTVTLRAPVLALPAGGASSQAALVFARQVGTTETVIDTISEAAVRLLDVQGFENFSTDGIAAVVQAVETANAAANFETLTPEQAVDAATTTAAADPMVQMALEENRFTPTPTATPSRCAGDCNSDGEVTVDEVIKGVNIALDNTTLSTCPALDVDGNGMVTINELIVAVNNVLNGCH